MSHLTLEELEEMRRQIRADRDPDAQPGFTSRQVMIDGRLRVPFLSAWLERRRARRE